MMTNQAASDFSVTIQETEMLQSLRHLREIIFKQCSKTTKQVKGKENFRLVRRVSISYAFFISGN